MTGEPNLTLGRLAPRLAHFPPLDTVVEKFWDYAFARRIREWQDISSEEAELVISIAGAVCADAPGGDLGSRGRPRNHPSDRIDSGAPSVFGS